MIYTIIARLSQARVDSQLIVSEYGIYINQGRFIMHGVVFKAAQMTVVLFAAAFISSLTFAGQHNTYASAGCMGCHQGEQVTVNSPAVKEHQTTAKEKHVDHSPQKINSSKNHAA